MSAISYDLRGKRVYVAGHRGMVGAAVVRRLAAEDCQMQVASRSELDLCDQNAVDRWFATARPHAVVLAAAKVGGIFANSLFPADFIYQNLVIETNVIGAAFKYGAEKLIFLGSSCIYPKFAPQPIDEDALLTGPLEPTNESYAIAKIAGLKMCEAFRRQYRADFISAMLTNLYGPGDNFDLNTSHVIPALIRKVHEAKIANAATVTIWGTGSPKREFLYVDDAADAIIHLLKTYSNDKHVNVGSGKDIKILELTKLVADIVGFRGEIVTDTSKPDGAPRKLMNVSKLLATGWRPAHSLREGLAKAYAWYCETLAKKKTLGAPD